MALHTELAIHKAAHDLFVYAITLARNFPRDVQFTKTFPGERK